ncbi:MAG: NUDIX hydrolase [Proteobacteria bacterium]|nr:MAG: NUDIX hydrolase [Pseudomonadota bacterium]QKK12336.1 MAG: NUDIX hydrolase [Pseudomonadota bacterium]
MVCKAAGRRIVSHNEPVALALIEHDDQLVLIQRTKAPLTGYWIPPAGHVEIGESVPQAVVREAREESGLEISLDGVVGIYSERGRSDTKSRMVITAFRSHSVGGVPNAGDDAGDIALFRRGQLPHQPPPEWGTSRDYWVHEVIQSILANWR